MSCYITQVGLSALMVAAWRGKTEAAVKLVKAGANVDMQNAVRTCTYIVYIVYMYKHNVNVYIIIWTIYK